MHPICRETLNFIETLDEIDKRYIYKFYNSYLNDIDTCIVTDAHLLWLPKNILKFHSENKPLPDKLYSMIVLLYSTVDTVVDCDSDDRAGRRINNKINLTELIEMQEYKKSKLNEKL
jgi:hypothetical protein